MSFVIELNVPLTRVPAAEDAAAERKVIILYIWTTCEEPKDEECHQG